MPGAISNQPSGINLFNQVASQPQVEKSQTAIKNEKSPSDSISSRDTVSISAEAQQRLQEETNKPDPIENPEYSEKAKLHSGTDKGGGPR